MAELLDFLPPGKRTELTYERLALLSAVSAQMTRATAAEKRLEALRKAVREIVDLDLDGLEEAQDMAREALARDDADALRQAAKEATDGQ